MEAAQFWMNMLPSCHVYEGDKVDKDYAELSYSVRVTVDRSQLLLEYPSANISPNLNPVSQLPADLQFYSQCRRIDLGRATIRILPEATTEAAAADKAPKVLHHERLNHKHPIIIETSEPVSDSSEESDKEEEDDDDDDDLNSRLLVLFARGRREKEIILRVLEDAVLFSQEQVRDRIEAAAMASETGLPSNRLPVPTSRTNLYFSPLKLFGLHRIFL